MPIFANPHWPLCAGFLLMLFFTACQVAVAVRDSRYHVNRLRPWQQVDAATEAVALLIFSTLFGFVTVLAILLHPPFWVTLALIGLAIFTRFWDVAGLTAWPVRILLRAVGMVMALHLLELFPPQQPVGYALALLIILILILFTVSGVANNGTAYFKRPATPLNP